MCVVSVPARIAIVEESLEDKFWSHARISINQGKTQVWNSGVDANGEPSGVWRGDHSLPRTSRASPFSALHWGTWTSCKASLMKRLTNIEFFWTESRKSPISNVLGSCSCCAPLPGQITCSGFLNGASKPSCAFQSHNKCGKWQVFHHWAVCA